MNRVITMKQTTFASLAFDKKKQSGRERFQAEMNAVVPWATILAVIEPHCPEAGRRGRPPRLMEAMLRIYFMQQWYALSDPATEVEHVFRVIKRQFGYTKVRYKGIARNAAQVFSLIGLTNLYVARRALMN